MLHDIALLLIGIGLLAIAADVAWALWCGLDLHCWIRSARTYRDEPDQWPWF